jgi:predicted KAP-like P-loop ATPase
MSIVAPPLEIASTDGFKNDILGREEYGIALLNIVKNSNTELVISIDGKWGEGKTTFVQMWQGLLNQSSVPNIYIDAFANDYLGDAFMSVASAITSFVEENIEKSNEEKAKDLKEKIAKVGLKTLSLTTKVAIKAATLGIIKENELDELSDIKSDISTGASNLIGGIIEEHLTSNAKNIKLIEEFKNLLSNITSKLGSDNKNPLVIIIDELDRCKPSFAVEMLEKIKHLFSVKNVVFVLVNNKEQLEESIKCIYGQNIDAHTYLQKFINVEIKLPKQVSNKHNNDLQKYIDKLFQDQGITLQHGEYPVLQKSILLLALHFDLSFRQLEKIFTTLFLFYNSTGNNMRIPFIVAIMSVIKIIRPDVFDKLLNKKISYDDICIELSLKDNMITDNDLSRIMMFVEYCLIPEEEIDYQDTRFEYVYHFLHHHDERLEIISDYAKKLNIFV